MNEDFEFLGSSFDLFTYKLLRSGKDFMKMIKDFIAKDQDYINDETIELLEPILSLEIPVD